jgi:hypothetical protein
MERTRMNRSSLAADAGGRAPLMRER